MPCGSCGKAQQARVWIVIAPDGSQHVFLTRQDADNAAARIPGARIESR